MKLIIYNETFIWERNVTEIIIDVEDNVDIETLKQRVANELHFEHSVKSYYLMGYDDKKVLGKITDIKDLKDGDYISLKLNPFLDIAMQPSYVVEHIQNGTIMAPSCREILDNFEHISSYNKVKYLKDIYGVEFLRSYGVIHNLVYYECFDELADAMEGYFMLPNDILFSVVDNSSSDMLKKLVYYDSSILTCPNDFDSNLCQFLNQLQPDNLIHKDMLEFILGHPTFKLNFVNVRVIADYFKDMLVQYRKFELIDLIESLQGDKYKNLYETFKEDLYPKIKLNINAKPFVPAFEFSPCTKNTVDLDKHLEKEEVKKDKVDELGNILDSVLDSLHTKKEECKKRKLEKDERTEEKFDFNPFLNLALNFLPDIDKEKKENLTTVLNMFANPKMVSDEDREKVVRNLLKSMC